MRWQFTRTNIWRATGHAVSISYCSIERDRLTAIRTDNVAIYEASRRGRSGLRATMFANLSHSIIANDLAAKNTRTWQSRPTLPCGTTIAIGIAVLQQQL